MTAVVEYFGVGLLRGADLQEAGIMGTFVVFAKMQTEPALAVL
jgi:hypothetical protein